MAKSKPPTGKHYPEIDPNPDFPKLEEKILAFWEREKLFEKSVKTRPARTPDGGNNEFIFYDGPPFANGLPHYGHLLTGYVKDLFARYQTMKGKRVERRFGWDCHGLPAEMGAEKELGISGRQQIEAYGIDKFNAHCRESVMKYRDEWRWYVTRQARWVDFDNDYKTMDLPYMESVIWAFKQLYEKGLVYEAYRVMPYSWAAETPVSNFETRLDNSYRERTDKAVTVAFELRELPQFFLDQVERFKKVTDPEGNKLNPDFNPQKYYVLAWTTTPWTLPSNLALAVIPRIDYMAFFENGNLYLASRNWVAKNKEEASKFNGYLRYVSGPLKGEGEIKPDRIIGDGEYLLGEQYVPLFPYFADHPNSFRILDGSDFVSNEDGTGIVHMAPGFGEDDQRVCEAGGIELVCPVDHRGRFTEEIYDIPYPPHPNPLPQAGEGSERKALTGEGILQLKGLNAVCENLEKYKFGEANERIIDYLKATGALVKQEQIVHNYPHCWRTDTPLIFRAMPSWYVEVTKFRDRMVELNQQIDWIPEHVRDGLFGKWLEGARDWSISRNRFWGAPIPVWKSDNPDNRNLYVFGSIKELEAFFKVKVEDLHRPFIDDLTAADPLDPQYTIRRVEDVFDCWFESGSMPYGQVHYPFAQKDWFETHFPADFIVEYQAQTRGWFYTLMVLATALFDKPPFLNCICHGVVLDDQGRKLSKRLNNYADPKELFDRFGADALRWFMMSSPVMRGLELQIDPEGKFIRDAVRLYLKPFWNAYNFFCLYANADGIRGRPRYAMQDGYDRWLNIHHPMDSYILTKLMQTVVDVTVALDVYDTPRACAAITGFFEDLNNWYIRRSKPRFWKEERDQDKQEAYDTLYTVLHVMARLTAPLLPLLAEEIFLGLTAQGQVDAKHSVHLADFPVFPNMAQVIDPQTAQDMDRVKDVCNAALAIRNARNLRVRLPLQSLLVVSRDPCHPEEYSDIVRDEVNVKEVRCSTEFDRYASLKLQINFPKVGAKFGPKMKEVIAGVKQGKWRKLPDGTVEVADEILEGDDFTLLLEPKPEYKQSAQPLAGNDALVILDTVVTPALEMEGIARDLVRMVQEARKKAGFDVSDRIHLGLDLPEGLTEAIRTHEQYIKEQTLALSLTGTLPKQAKVFENDLDGQKVKIGVALAA